MKFTELRAALAAVPWKAAADTGQGAENHPGVAGFTRGQATETARFIAAASPDVIRALLAELDRLRTPLDNDAAHEVFVGWYLDGGGGAEFVRRVEVAHGIREA